MAQIHENDSLETFGETFGVSTEELEYWDRYEISGLQLNHWDFESQNQAH